MRETVTTLLDAIGLLLLAAGAGFAASYAIGPAGMAVAGGVVLVGSSLSAWLGRPRKPRGES